MCEVENEPILAMQLLEKCDGYLQCYLSSVLKIYPSDEENINITILKLYSILYTYCIFQFRNTKANNFNILYLALAERIQKKKSKPCLKKQIELISSIISANYIDQDKEQFTDTPSKESLEYCSYYVQDYKQTLIKGIQREKKRAKQNDEDSLPEGEHYLFPIYCEPEENKEDPAEEAKVIIPEIKF